MRRNVAARWAGYAEKIGGSLGVAVAGPMAPAGELIGPPRVELFIDEQWVDITGFVRYAEGINIRRGKSDETSNLSPSSCTFTLMNYDGRFSLRNPTSIYYGKIGRNTRIRVSVIRNGTRYYRFHGEISSWPTTADVTNTDVTIAIEASGPSRRLGQGLKPLSSTLYRAITKPVTSLIEYWPFEDAAGAATIASAIGGHSMTFVGAPSLHSFTRFNGSDDLPVLSATTEFKAAILPYTTTDYLQVTFVLAVPASGATSGVLVRLNTTGTIALIDIFYSAGGNLGVAVYDPDSILITSGSGPVTGLDGGLFLVSLEITQQGSDVSYLLETLAQGEQFALGVGGGASTTVVGRTFGRATKITVTPDGGNDQFTIGHIFLQTALTSKNAMANEFNGAIGERAGRRAERLCAQESASFHALGDLDDTVQMGAQKPAKLLDLLEDTEEADLGVLIEPRDDLGFTFRTRTSLLNQTAALTLDHSASALSEPLTEVPDDQRTRNEITATRVNGSSFTATKTSGRLSIQDPPAGVGKYDDAPEINLYSDSQLPDHAGFRLLLGTVEEPRFPSIKIELSRAYFNDPALLATAMGIDLGDRLVVSNPPSHLGPDDISQIVQGYIERIDQFTHEIDFNGTPESPYRVAVTDDTVLGRADTEGSQLAVDVDSAAVTMSVATTSGPLWTTVSAHFPFDVRLGGEVVTVTNITGASSPQTFTVTRSVNGVVKTQVAGTAISLDQPAYVGLE